MYLSNQKICGLFVVDYLKSSCAMNAKHDPSSLIESERSLPGDLAIWVFIFAELLVFGILFAAYAFARSHNIELFNSEQKLLNTKIALVNTLLLITSSYAVVRAVLSIKNNENESCVRWLLLAIGLGAVFLFLKIREFLNDAYLGITLSHNLFDMFYLSLTFFHFLHVILGMIILGAVAWRAHLHKYSAQLHAGVETGGAYWHMVDLLWIILFALVYVIH